MDESEKRATDFAMETRPITEAGGAVAKHLKGSGKCRQSINEDPNLHFLGGSLLTEQQKLRHALAWARSFLNERSEVQYKIGTANDFRETQNQQLKNRFHVPFSCNMGRSEIFGGQEMIENVWQIQPSNYNSSEIYNKRPPSDDPCALFSIAPRREEVNKDTSVSENMILLQDNAFRLSNHYITRNAYKSNQRACTDYATCLVKESILFWNSADPQKSTVFGPESDTPSWMPGSLIKPADVFYKTGGAQSKREAPVNQKAQDRVETKTEAVKDRPQDAQVRETEVKASEEQDVNWSFMVNAKKNVSQSESEATPQQAAAKIPAKLPLGEQYQLCVDHLCRLRTGRSHRTKPGGIIESPDNFTKASDKKRRAAVINKNRDRITHTSDGATPADKGGSKSCDLLRTKQPAGVPVFNQWLCLPDEVWLSILSLLSPSGLCRVAQVCRRLHTLATDHSLWKTIRIESFTLTDQWLLSVGGRRPHSLILYRCSGLSVTHCGLENFFSLCRHSLEELKVTSCTETGLHGDLILRLIGQLCNHLTSVDVSWSGATDAGVKALTEGHAGQRLEAVVLNGCQITDDPLIKLIERHKTSLCRLEVFGCRFLTSACLQSVCEMCPGLKHLNVGQVPKVNAHCLTVMTSRLKCLVSLNLTGLQAVTDATVDVLLQRCVDLQSLTLSSCPGVTDLTLHSISKHTPCIRCLDVSGCEAITDAGLQSLAVGCRRLQQLDLSSTGTRSRGVTLLSNYCSGHLHTVKLSFCRISAESILKLCRRCKRLKLLHLYGCAQIPNEVEIREVNTAVKLYPLP